MFSLVPHSPGMMRRGEVEARAELLLDFLVRMKFGAVVRGEAAHRMRFFLQDGYRSTRGTVGGGTGQLADAHQSAFAFDGRHHAGLSPAMHGVEFPVAEALAPFHHRGTLTDHRFARQSSSTVVANVALAPLFLRPAQAMPQGAPTLLLRPDIQVDGSWLITGRPSRRCRPTICSGLHSSRSRSSMTM